MILDQMNSDVLASYNPEFQKAFRFIASLTPDSPLGKTAIDGDAVYANVMEYDTSLTEPESLEAHEKYVDIQAVISGAEVMAWANTDGLKEKSAYDAAKDVRFVYAPKHGVSRLELIPGLFAVFYPEDGHYGKFIPSSGAGKVKKVVVKVKL